jgi:hypothetical protein
LSLDTLRFVVLHLDLILGEETTHTSRSNRESRLTSKKIMVIELVDRYLDFGVYMSFMWTLCIHPVDIYDRNSLL